MLGLGDGSVFDYRGGKLYIDLSKYGHQTKF